MGSQHYRGMLNMPAGLAAPMIYRRARRVCPIGCRVAMAAFSDTLADAVRFASPAGAEWRQRTTRMRLAALECQALHALTLAELHELAELEAQLHRAPQAKEVLLHLKAQPGGPFPHAELLHGRLLLAEDDDRGLFLFEMAATHDAALAHVTAEEGAQFLRRTRGKRAAELWAVSLRSHAD